MDQSVARKAQQEPEGEMEETETAASAAEALGYPVAARDLLTRLPLLSSLLEQIIQGGIDPSLVNVAPQRAIGSNDPISAVFLGYPVAARDLLTRLPLMSSLLEQIIQGGIDPSLVNVAPQRAIGSNDPISAVFLHDLDAVNGGFFPSVSGWNERKVC